MPAPIPQPEIGTRFGHWTVIDNNQKTGKLSFKACLCQCDCGNKGVVRSVDLRLGRSKSCGCYYGVQKVPHHTSHGDSRTRLYVTWTHVLNRCCDPKNYEYKNYGGRGIKVCDEWASDFQKFKSWALANGYSDDLTLDRIDVNGNYEPSNCRWVSNLEQQNNRRNNVNITYEGRTQSVSMWAREYGINRTTLAWRIKQGWSIEKALNQPLRSGGRKYE